MEKQLTQRITFIGSGAMGEAMIASILRGGLTSPDSIAAADPRHERVEELRKKYGIRPHTDNRAAAEGAGVVVLSVKPQRLTEVLGGLRGAVPEQALVLSIVAGATLEKIGAGLGHMAVARAMPNTPAQIGEGITVWIPSEAVEVGQKETARLLLGAFGEEIMVDDESYLDMATALSGTGPAYAFMFMEAMIDAGVHMGFPRHVSERLVVQTLRGAVDYYEQVNAQSGVHVAALRNQVTSPGGTSAEALYYLEKAGFRTAISRAIWAAYQRSLELGKEKTAHNPEKDGGDASQG